MKYRIVMNTELGGREGVLTLERKEDALHGQLSLLGMETAIHGQIDQDGNYQLHGELITPVSIRPFYARGNGLGQTLTFMIDDGIRTYTVNGVSI